MDKDEILDNNKQCENVECYSESKQNVHDDCVERIPEEDLCIGGGIEDEAKIAMIVAYGAINKFPSLHPCVDYGGAGMFPKTHVVKYGGPKIFENKKSQNLVTTQPDEKG